MAAVDLTKIAQVSVVDTSGNWGYLVVDATAFVDLKPGAGSGTIGRVGGAVHTFTVADPSATVAQPPLAADAPYNPEAT